MKSKKSSLLLDLLLFTQQISKKDFILLSKLHPIYIKTKQKQKKKYVFIEIYLMLCFLVEIKNLYDKYYFDFDGLFFNITCRMIYLTDSSYNIILCTFYKSKRSVCIYMFLFICNG
jgi:hypothetical protein